MGRNLDLSQGMISAEAVMMALAPHVGREQAHHLVAAACHRAIASGRHLRDALAEDSEITEHLSPERLDGLLDPRNYTGLAAEFVDRVLAQRPGRSD
jgi:3-carboxy-cis,cis-muconate cycloisomerase